MALQKDLDEFRTFIEEGQHGATKLEKLPARHKETVGALTDQLCAEARRNAALPADKKGVKQGLLF